MMIPTNYLRWARSRQVAYEGSAPTLQQWWSNDGSGPDASQGEMVPDPTNRTMAYITVSRRGEWRDVPIAEE